MAKKSASTAKKTNRAVLAVVFVLIAGAASAALWGEPAQAPTAETTTTPAPLDDPTTGPGTRPAEVSYSWFDHGMSVEQTDYPMDELSCETLAETVTPDICAVAETTHGSFMLSGVEGYWDPADRDSDGLAQIPFDMTLFTMRRDQSIPRAASVMDGYFEKAYTNNKAQVDLFRARVNGDDVLVVVKRLSDGAPDAYAFSDSVQIIAASSTGAPTVVATYEGSAIKVASDGKKIVISSLRYRSTADSEEAQWFTRLTLTPSADDPALWLETLTSGPTAVTNGQGMTRMGTHTFAATRRSSSANEAGKY